MIAWLITWTWMGDHAAVKDPIVTILSARIGEKSVRDYVERRYIEKYSSLDEKLSYARYNDPQKAPYAARLEHGRIDCGDNPWLHARLVEDLRVEMDIDGNDVLKWTEPAPVRARDV